QAQVTGGTIRPPKSAPSMWSISWRANSLATALIVKASSLASAEGGACGTIWTEAPMELTGGMGAVLAATFWGTAVKTVTSRETGGLAGMPPLAGLAPVVSAR